MIFPLGKLNVMAECFDCFISIAQMSTTTTISIELLSSALKTVQNIQNDFARFSSILLFYDIVILV